MNKTSKMLKVYEHSSHNKVRKLASPLEQFFGLEEFVYTKLTNDGEFFAISNLAEPSEFYFNQGLFKNNLLIRHPDNYSTGPLFPGTIAKTKNTGLMKENFGLSDDNSLVIFRKTGDGCHKFLFNTTRNHSSILNFYLTNLSLLEKFCDHFLKEWEFEKSTTEKFSVNIANLIGPAFYDLTYAGLNKNQMTEKTKFFQSLENLPHGFEKILLLSAQEKAALSLLAKGYSAKDIALKMHISPRTVEHYIDSIKNKLGCLTKKEIIDCFHSAKQLGLI